MFTGIIERTGRVTQFERGYDCISVVIRSDFADLKIGESVAVDGVCLTVVETNSRNEALFFVSPETLARTSFKTLAIGSTVNLERAVPAQGRLSGHVVQGHVDGIASLVGIQVHEKSHELAFELPTALARYCVEKGSIAINGISLTVNQIRGPRISVMIIPHTWQNTNLEKLRPGDQVNVEVDILAKYVEKLFARPGSPLSMEGSP
jgi:riboflavin synthase